MTIETTLLVLLIFVAAAGTHTIFGFGFGLVSMPLLALTIDIKIATPLVALVSNSVSLYLLTQYWREIELKSAWKLILASAVGTPLGLLLVKCAPGNLVTGLLGLLLIALGLYNLTQPRLPQLQWPHWAFGFGFAAGILGSAYNTSGPPVIIYGTLRRWSSNRFRATLQSYFVPAGLVVIISHGVGGLWTTEVFWLALLSLPALLLGLVVGLLIGRRISGQRFTQALYICLILLGLLLLS